MKPRLVAILILVGLLPLSGSIPAGPRPATDLGPVDGQNLPGEDLERVRTGDAAPDFLLEDHRGERVRLSEFRARRPVVLVFYRGKW